MRLSVVFSYNFLYFPVPIQYNTPYTDIEGIRAQA